MQNLEKSRGIATRYFCENISLVIFVPRTPLFSLEDNFSTRGLCPRVETVSEGENHGVQGTNITFYTKGTEN